MSRHMFRIETDAVKFCISLLCTGIFSLWLADDKEAETKAKEVGPVQRAESAATEGQLEPTGLDVRKKTKSSGRPHKKTHRRACRMVKQRLAAPPLHAFWMPALSHHLWSSSSLDSGRHSSSSAQHCLLIKFHKNSVSVSAFGYNTQLVTNCNTFIPISHSD